MVSSARTCLSKDLMYFSSFNRIQGGAPAHKLVLGIPTAARTWKLDSESEISGVPPIHADGAGEAGMLEFFGFYWTFSRCTLLWMCLNIKNYYIFWRPLILFCLDIKNYIFWIPLIIMLYLVETDIVSVTYVTFPIEFGHIQCSLIMLCFLIILFSLALFTNKYQTLKTWHFKI